MIKIKVLAAIAATALVLPALAQTAIVRVDDPPAPQTASAKHTPKGAAKQAGNASKAKNKHARKPGKKKQATTPK